MRWKKSLDDDGRGGRMIVLRNGELSIALDICVSTRPTEVWHWSLYGPKGYIGDYQTRDEARRAAARHERGEGVEQCLVAGCAEPRGSCDKHKRLRGAAA